MLVYRNIWSPVGDMVAVADETHVHALQWHSVGGFEAILARTATRAKEVPVEGSSRALGALEVNLNNYFEGLPFEFPPAVLPGYSHAILTCLQGIASIPFGETRTFAQIGQERGRAASTVSKAVRACDVAIIVPTHRTLDSEGRLRTYPGGLWRKKYLQELEARALAVQKAKGAA